MKLVADTRAHVAQRPRGRVGQGLEGGKGWGGGGEGGGRADLRDGEAKRDP